MGLAPLDPPSEAPRALRDDENDAAGFAQEIAMTFEIAPVWPWSEVRQFLADADGSVRAAVWLTALAAFALPLLFLRLSLGSPAPAHPHRPGPLVWPGRLLGTALRFAQQQRRVRERLGNCGLALLVIGPAWVVGWMVRVISRTARNHAAAACLVGDFASAGGAAGPGRRRPAAPGLSRYQPGSAVIWIDVDTSESMTIKDESGQSRWDYLLRTLRDCQPILERLRTEQGIETEFFHFARDTSRWQPDQPGKPDGKHTDIGGSLHWLQEQRDRRPLKGLFLLSDGRNTGSQQLSPLSEARLEQGGLSGPHGAAGQSQHAQQPARHHRDQPEADFRVDPDQDRNDNRGPGSGAGVRGLQGQGAGLPRRQGSARHGGKPAARQRSPHLRERRRWHRSAAGQPQQRGPPQVERPGRAGRTQAHRGAWKIRAGPARLCPRN